MNGVYRALLRLATPALVASRLPKVFGLYMNFGMNFGGATTVALERGILLQLKRVPGVLVAWLELSVESFVMSLLGAAGGRDITMVMRATDRHEGNKGDSLVDVEFEARWK